MSTSTLLVVEHAKRDAAPARSGRLMLTRPVFEPGVAGVSLTWTLHVSPDASGPVQVFDEMVNCAVPTGSRMDTEIGEVGIMPMFATEKVVGALSRPMTTLPNADDVSVVKS